MILTGKQILEEVNKGDIVISPFIEKRLNPNSYNLTLSPEIAIYENRMLDLKIENKLKHSTISQDGLQLLPGQLYLAKTNEYTETLNHVPLLEGRSSIARLGIFIHVTAGFGDIGFKGNWTLEIAVIQPVKIYPNIEICQIYYHTTFGNTSIKYEGKYNSKEILPSKIYKEIK